MKANDGHPVAAAASPITGSSVKKNPGVGGCCAAPVGDRDKRFADSWKYRIAATRESDGATTTVVKSQTELVDLSFALEGELGGQALRNISAARKRLGKLPAASPTADSVHSFLDELAAIPVLLAIQHQTFLFVDNSV